MDALSAMPHSVEEIAGVYSRYINPQWVRLLSLLQMNVSYSHCLGAEIFSGDGRRFLDFLSGYCVHNVGHNHPKIVAALKQELDHAGPAMLQSHVSELAAELASRLCERAGGRLSRAFSAAQAVRESKQRSSLRALIPAAPACFTPRGPSTGSLAARFP